jgi:hypothetical protein
MTNQCHRCVCSNNIFSKTSLAQIIRYNILSHFITSVVRECSEIFKVQTASGGLACNVNLGPISMSRRADWVEARLPREDSFCGRVTWLPGSSSASLSDS